MALAVVGVVYAGHIVVQNLFQLAFLRAFLGFAQAGVLPALYSLTNINAPADRRGGIIAVASSMTILGTCCPMIGGFVAGHFGITALFIANSCMLLGMSLIIRRNLTDTPVVHATTAPTPTPVPVPVTNRGQEDS